MKGSGEDEIWIFFEKVIFKVCACDHSQITILYTSYIIQVYFTLNLFAKYIAIFKIWMDNWRMVLANLEKVVWRKRVARIEWYR